MANSPGGGVIVLGLQTKKRKHEDVIERVMPFDLSTLDVTRCRRILGARSYPVLEGLSFRKKKIQGELGIAYIEVPSQPDNFRPFMVWGRVSDGRVRNHYFTIPIRRGSEIEYLNPASIHSHIVAGRAAKMAPLQDQSAKGGSAAD